MKRVLITGLSGWIGHYLYLSCPPGIKLSGTVRDDDRFNPPSHQTEVTMEFLDLYQPVAKQLDDLKVDILIHTAAMSSMGECEKDGDAARQINFKATYELAEWCRQRDCRFVYLSTDIVFDGHHAPYREDDTPQPINQYGITKLQGEKSVASILRDYTIVRIALGLGRGIGNTSNFVDWFLDKINRNQTITLFKDEVRTPTAIRPLARAIWQIALSPETGIFHLCGQQKLNRLQLGKLFCDELGQGHELLKPISLADTKDYPRPADVSMQSTRSVLGKKIQIPPISDYITYMIR
ncbi:MAG: sugar nucleotide-binding protein [Caldithrix sp.]|nr:sugar nucleotide-binding protein [Caldithrix sp.]